MADSDITIVGLTAAGGVSQAVLAWAVNDPNVSGLPYFRFHHAEVWRSTLATMASPERIDGGEAATAFVDLPLPRGQKYYYQARSVDQSGRTGEYSDIKSATEISGDVLIAANGYWKDPIGLIMQWGYDFDSGAGSKIISFPMPFPTLVFTIVCTHQWGNNNNVCYEVNVSNVGRTSFVAAFYQISAGAVNIGGGFMRWIAIGY